MFTVTTLIEYLNEVPGQENNARKINKTCNRQMSETKNGLLLLSNSHYCLYRKSQALLKTMLTGTILRKDGKI